MQHNFQRETSRWNRAVQGSKSVVPVATSDPSPILEFHPDYMLFLSNIGKKHDLLGDNSPLM
jgi:hypothetical protein